MQDIQQLCIKANCLLREVLEQMETHRWGVCILVDEEGKPLGIFTDPDVRRILLKGIQLDEFAIKYANRSFKSWSIGQSVSDGIAWLKEKGESYRHLPVVDEKGVLVDVILRDEYSFVRSENRVVIMAGGMGTRLLPLTKDRPKPLIEVHGKTILERIIENFKENGFFKFTICINHLGQQIEDYFEDGQRWNVKINYIKEKEMLGTAGALAYLHHIPEHDFFVINGDVLTNLNFLNLLKYHREKNASATMCVSNYVVEVPYGVVDVNGIEIERIVEKPVHQWYVNAGIYCLSPSVLRFIDQGERLDMTTLFQRISEQKEKSVYFPIQDAWFDVGKIKDLQKAEDHIRKSEES
jgi:dTDP-glucose pyrophosphorylase